MQGFSSPLSALLSGVSQGQQIINQAKQNQQIQSEIDQKKAMMPFLMQKMANEQQLQQAQVDAIPVQQQMRQAQLQQEQAEAGMKQQENQFRDSDYYQNLKDLQTIDRFSKIQTAQNLYEKGLMTQKELDNFQQKIDDEHNKAMAQINRDKARSKTKITDPATGHVYVLDQNSGDFLNTSTGERGNVNQAGMNLTSKADMLTTSMKDQKQKIMAYYPEVTQELQSMKDLYHPGLGGDIASTKIGSFAVNYLAPGKLGLQLSKESKDRNLLETKIANMTDKIVSMTGLPKTDESIEMIKHSISPKYGESNNSYNSRVNSFLGNLKDNLQSLSKFTPETMKAMGSNYNFNDSEDEEEDAQ